MILGDMVGAAAENPASNAAGQELRTLLKTVGSGRGAARAGSYYGSEGWGFESLRARPAQRLVPILGPAFCLPRTAANYSNADRNGGS